MDKNKVLHDLRVIAKAFNKLCKDIEVGNYNGDTVTIDEGKTTETKEDNDG